MPDDDLKKWIDASIKATELKFALENILTKSFSHEEMESVKYKQLLDTVDQYLEHVMGQYRREKEKKLVEACCEELEKIKKDNEKLKKDNEKLKKSCSIFNIKSASIASIGAIIVEAIRLILGIIKGG